MGMKTIRYVHWQDGNMWLGYLEDYPDYMTQGESLEELQENLKDLYEDLTGGYIPGVRKVIQPLFEQPKYRTGRERPWRVHAPSWS